MSTTAHSEDLHQILSQRSDTTSTEKPFTRAFFDKNNAPQRAIYFKIVFGGVFALILCIFAIFSIFWGALWKTPERNLNGWVIDFDGGLIGQSVTQALTSQQVSSLGKVTWTSIPSSQFANLEQVPNDVREQKTWVAIAINPGSTARLQASLLAPNASYDGSEAITVYGAEARNENAYRSLISPSSQTALNMIAHEFALQLAGQQAQSSNLAALLSTSPQTLVAPISFTMHNVAPFDRPVASAVTFVGLIYQLILSFFIVNICNTARQAAQLDRNLNLRSLIAVRFVSAFAAYFFVALFYALLSVAFQLDFSRKFGHSGFLVFWMLNWVGMLSVGLALDSLLTLLTIRFIPFFMILWIIINVSVCIFPIEVLPIFFRYGYAMPFYNVSHAVRAIVFGTKNTVGMNFGILLVWVAISCISLPLIQWFVRRRDAAQPGPSSQQGSQPEKLEQHEA